MARNRLRRIRRAIENDQKSYVDPAIEELTRPVPKDTYVGFGIAFFDIETTNLSALMGRILCASISDSWGNVTTARATDFEQSSPIDDRGICEWLRDELEKYDILVGWNSKMFDIPFLNGRLLFHGSRICRSDLMHVDPMWNAKAGKAGARIGSAKLDNVAKFLRLPEQKTPLDWETWQLAATGDDAALDLVVEHCEADVLVLRGAFHRLKGFIRNVHR